MDRQLDDWIKHFLILNDNSEPSTLYKEWVAVSTIAAVLQRKCYTVWEKMIYPNFYIILVGPSGARKGTAMGQGYEFLRQPRMAAKLSAESTTREALIRRLRKSEIAKTADGPMAHSSMTIYSEELAVFIGQNNLEFISALTDWFDCKDPWRYETKTQGEDTINGIWVNLLGATTPNIIKNVLPQDAIGGGLTSRIIFVYAPGREKLVPIPIRTKAENDLAKVLGDDLEKISMTTGEFVPTQDYIQIYIDWYREHDKKPPFEDDKFGGYNDRRALHLRKLSMIMSASRSSDMQLTVADFTRALNLLRRTERLMPRVFSSYGRLDTSVIMDRLMHTIAYKGEILEVDLLRTYVRDVSREELENMLTTLEKIGYCKISMRPGMPRMITYTQQEQDKENNDVSDADE